MCKQIQNKKTSFYFTFSSVENFAQHLQIDNIYHRKERKISYLGVHLVNLGETFPCYGVFDLNSTGLFHSGTRHENWQIA